MAEVWDIYGRTSKREHQSRDGGWRLTVQTARDEQREREALGMRSKRSDDASAATRRTDSPGRRRTKS